jgi:hypothetical protein
MKKIVSLFIAISCVLQLFAQGVAVNTDGSTADPSAMLDVKSNNQGILIPRVASTASITSPVTGLLIFQTTAPVGFYYYDGATWDYLQNSANANVTLQGNTFNAANNLLKLDASGKVPIANLGTSGTPSAGTYLDGSNTWVTVPAGLTNGSSAGQIYLTGISPFAPQAPQSVTGDVTISSTAVTSYNNIIPTNKGGAGNVNGILSANGSGTVSAASTTGTGSVVLASGTTGSGSAVLAVSPTLVTPSLGTIASGNGAALTGLQNIANNSTAGNSIVTALGSATSGTTGSGNVVLASSPTLVTPSLGTPSALVGTNISGTAANLTAGNVTTDANLTGAVTSVGNATSYNTIVPIAKGGTGTATPSLVAGTNVTITGSFPNQTITAAGGGSSAQGLQYGTIVAGSNNITVSDLTIRTIVSDLSATTATGVTVNLTLPSASSYAAGTIIVWDLTNYISGTPAINLQSTGSTISGFNINNVSVNTSASIGSAARISFLSDGGTHWYKVI